MKSTGDRALDIALWAGDVTALQKLAPCVCCCSEHTFNHCPARAWYGCRGQGAMTRADQEAWCRHYMTHHGMTEDEFYGMASDPVYQP